MYRNFKNCFLGIDFLRIVQLAQKKIVEGNRNGTVDNVVKSVENKISTFKKGEKRR